MKQYIYPMDPRLMISAGLIDGHQSADQFGRNPAVPSDTEVTLWEVNPSGKNVFPTSDRLHDLVSTSATDIGSLVSSGSATSGDAFSIIDSAATFIADGVAPREAVINDSNNDHGVVVSVVSETELTLHVHHSRGFSPGDDYRIISAPSSGVSVVHIHGLSPNMAYQQEYVMLDGLTPVSTVLSYWRINNMDINGSPGTPGCSNEGDIIATAAVDSTITCKISIGRGSSKQAIYTVGKNHTLFLMQYNASVNRSTVNNTGAVDITLKESLFAPLDGGGCRVIEFRGLSASGSSTFEHTFPVYRAVNELTDIWMEVSEATSNGMDISGGFAGILVKRIEI